MGKSFLILMGVAVLAGTRFDPLPMMFIGTWDIDAESCADEDGVTRLRVAEDGLYFYEWGGTVVSVDSQPDGRTLLQMDWSDVNDVDGEDVPVIRRRSALLGASQDANRLSVEFEGESVDYVRCPEGLDA